jgi:tetratricopeptide (TPR) repeat protein
MSTQAAIERYAQLMAEDPASPAFVEYARALVDASEFEQAVQVCEEGLGHHPQSVVGRVLWGKALLHLGRPAEAMEQFDAAISGDKDNVQTYNLISEVLLRKGLYRSAVPLLRKAVALAPEDGRAKTWLEQAQRALTGGPAPVLTDLLALELAALEGGAGNVSPPASPADPDADQPRTEADLVLPAPDGWAVPPTLPHTSPGARAPAATAEEEDPYERVLEQPASSEVEAGLSELFEHPEDTVPGVQLPAEPSVVVDPVPAARKQGGRKEREPKEGRERKERKVVGREAPAPPPPPELTDPGLLGEIPDAPKSAIFELPREVRAAEPEPSLREYERSVREQLGRASKESGLRRHAGKWAAAAAGLLVLGAGVGTWWAARRAQGGMDVQDALTVAHRGLLEDTPEAYGRALEALGRAEGLSPGRPDVQVLTAWVHAVRYGELGGPESDKAAAEALLGRVELQERFPHRVAAAKSLLERPRPGAPCPAAPEPGVEAPELRVLAARCLFAQGRPEPALAQVRAVLDAEPRNVRALVALGDYQRAAGDAPAAEGAYEAALGLSPAHAGAWLGLAELRLPRREKLAETLDGVAALSRDGRHPDAAERLGVVRARLLSGLGRHAEAREALDAAAKAYPHRAFAFSLARGEVLLQAGYVDEAQQAFEAALAADPKSEPVREALGRLLLRREKPREVLQRIQAEPGERRAALVRGLAAAAVGDARTARAEFTRAAAEGQQPVEAVVQWALLDAAGGDAARSEQVLERALEGAGRWRSAVLVGLGRLALMRKDGDKARARFEEASRDAEDFEGNCQLGQAWLAQGQPERAVDPLQLAVKRNPAHLEAHEALVDALLSVPRFDEAVKAAAAAAAAAPGAARLHRLHALALVRAARAPEAEGPSAQAVKLDGSDAVAWRIRAQVLAARGQGDEAFKALQRSNALDATAPETFCEIGLTFLRRGQAELAYQAFRAAQRETFGLGCALAGLVLPVNPASNRAMLKDVETLVSRATRAHERGLLKAVRAHLLTATGDLSAARAEIDEAALLAPSSAQVHRARMALAQKGQDAVTFRAALLDAARAEPGWASLRLQAADLLARGGRDDQVAAIGEYEAYGKLTPNRAEAVRVQKLAEGLRKATGTP